MIKRELYRHRQAGWTIIVTATLQLVVLALFRPHARPDVVFWGGVTLDRVWVLPVILVAVVTLLFSSLRVVVTTDMLEISFGPGLIRKRWSIADIADAKVTRTSLWMGWGIHVRRHATVFNVSGFDAVRITLKAGRSIVIGSDDAVRLTHVIEGARART